MSYLNIVKHYEDCFLKHGDNHKGMDWPNEADALTRYQVMLEILNTDKNFRETSILDFGCGTAHLNEYIQVNNIEKIHYSGLDLSAKFTDAAKSKYPGNKFYTGDILTSEINLPNFDFIIMNGVFTEKRELSNNEMWEYFTTLLTKVFGFADRGIAFNVMSKNVDWEREDLFHVSLDQLSSFLCKDLSRNFIIRNDYGLYEYTVYLYK